MKVRETFEYEVNSSNLGEIFTYKDSMSMCEQMTTPPWDGSPAQPGELTDYKIEVIGMSVAEAISLVNDNDDVYYSLFDINELLEEHGLYRVAKGINMDQFRWYSTAIDVYKCTDGFIGVSGLFQSFSEMQSASDCNVICEVFEMEQVPTVTYKVKPKDRKEDENP